MREPRRSPAAALVRWGLGLIAAWLGLTTAAWAHPMPESRVWIDTTAQGLRLTLQLPLNRLEYGFGQPLADAPDTVMPQHRQALTNYVTKHVGVMDEQGRPWTVDMHQLIVQGHDASAELEAVMDLHPPVASDPRGAATLVFDAITHEVRTHRVQVFLRNDWAAGRVPTDEAPQLLGLLDHAHTRLAVPLAPVRWGAAWASLLRDGMQHIAEGADHLLFLLMLLIVAPLTRSGTRWQGVRPALPALRHVAGVVTAFTVGHSLTLAAGSLGWVHPVAQWVEVGVAATVALAALHALRPWFRQAEWAMALVFGTVHGLAFSASLNGAGLSAWQHAQALLAFNLGIELMQCLVILTVLPPLWLLARTQARLYAGGRSLLALLGAALALAWIVERCGWSPWGIWTGADVALAQAPWAVLLLWGAAGITWWMAKPRPAMAG
jgi:hypothetical protein